MRKPERSKPFFFFYFFFLPAFVRIVRKTVHMQMVTLAGWLKKHHWKKKHDIAYMNSKRYCMELMEFMLGEFTSAEKWKSAVPYSQQHCFIATGTCNISTTYRPCLLFTVSIHLPRKLWKPSYCSLLNGGSSSDCLELNLHVFGFVCTCSLPKFWFY